MATSGNSVTSNIAEQETVLKKQKSRAKSSFTRARNKLLFLLEEQELPSRREVKELCQKVDSYLETAMDVMTKLSDFFLKSKQMNSGRKVVLEMEKVEEEFYTKQLWNIWTRKRKADRVFALTLFPLTCYKE